MLVMEQATDVRKEWSAVCDSVIREKPKFIKRTRDRMWFSSLDTMADILEAYPFTAKVYKEADGSITLSMNEIDLVENGRTMEEARLKLGTSLLEYSTDYYEDYELYSHSPNRKKHIPYVFRALIMDDPSRIGDAFICQDGKN